MVLASKSIDRSILESGANFLSTGNYYLTVPTSINRVTRCDRAGEWDVWQPQTMKASRPECAERAPIADQICRWHLGRLQRRAFCFLRESS
jgi:hypothetical protein